MARTAPVPNFPAIPGMNPGLFVMGGGGDGGGSGAGGGKGGKNKQGANGKNGGNDANGGGKCAGGSGGGCTIHQSNPAAGDPVELSTGRVFTVPQQDVHLPGPMSFAFIRQYSSLARDRDVGLGFGWSHSLAYAAHVRRRSIVVLTPEGKSIRFPRVKGDVTFSPDGWALWPEGEGYAMDAMDGIIRYLAPLDGGPPDELVLQSIRDMNSNTIQMVYEHGLLSQVIDSAQRRVVLRRGPQGRIASIEVKNADAQGRWIQLVSYTHDDLGDLATVTDADGFSTKFVYADHFMAEMRLPSGLVFHYVYGPDGRCCETWGDYPGASDPSLAPDVPGVLADGVTKAKGVHHVKIEFGPDGYVEAVDSVQVLRYFMNEAGFAAKSVSAGGVTTREFDAFGYLTALTDPEGGTTTYARDYRGRVLKEIDPLGRTRTYVRNDRGLETEITEPDGTQHFYEYDSRGNMIRRRDTLGRITEWRHDTRGLVTEKIEANGGVTRYDYNAQGSLVQETFPNGTIRKYMRDGLGRVCGIRNGLGGEVRCAYTDGSRKIAIYDADGTVSRFTYDGARRLTQVVNPNGTVVSYEYGGFDRLVATHLPTGEVLRCLYNREGWLMEVRNPAGDPFKYRHTLEGLVEAEEPFDGRVIRYKRDLMGRVVASEDSAGGRTLYEYDAAGQLVKKTLPDGAEHFLEYDLLGRPIAMRSPAGEFTLQRDAMGMIVREVQVVDGRTFTVEHAYDVTHDRVRTSTSLGHVEEIERDAHGKRLRARVDGRHVVTHTLDAIGEEVARSFDAGGRLDLAFDPVGRLTHLRVASPFAPTQGARPGEPAWMGQAGGASLERLFQWAPGDDLTAVSDPLRGTTEAYEWDPRHRFLGRVTGQHTQDATRYDAAGNHHELKGNRAYARGNRLMEKGTTRYTWDELGRLIEKHVQGPGGDDQIWKYEWDGAGRLKSVLRPDQTRVDLAYDPIGRRVQKREIRAVLGEEPATTQVVRFVWDGDRLVHEIRERASDEGDPIVEERTYCYPDDRLTPWSQRVVEKVGDTLVKNEWHYYVADQAGAPVALVDSAGRVACEMERTPWGAMKPLPGNTVDTPFRLQGQYDDPEIGLAYNRHRYYDPDAGLFISPDPINLSGGTLNLFGYGENTITDIDLFGLWHTASATLDGVQVPNSQTGGTDFNSGGWGVNPNPANRDSYLGGLARPQPPATPATFGTLYRQSHSEFKIMRELAPPDGQTANPALAGRTLRIDGASRSCPNCAAELDRFAQRNNMRVEYHSPGANPPLVCDFRNGGSSSNRESYSQTTAASY